MGAQQQRGECISIPERDLLAVRALVVAEKLVVVLLVGPRGEEEGEGGADRADDGEDARVVHAEGLSGGPKVVRDSDRR